MAGVGTAPPEFFRELRRLCDERGMLLIFDEVQTGVGRTGSWFFAGSEAAGRVVPDVITLAKSLGSGVPVGACLTTESGSSSIRSEEHTSELQSRQYLVCRLLLEKKKKSQ